MGQLVGDRPRGGHNGSTKRRPTTSINSKLVLGPVQLFTLLNEGGGIIHDLIVYRTAPEGNSFCRVNASCTNEDCAWLEKHCPNDVNSSFPNSQCRLRWAWQFKVHALSISFFHSILGDDVDLPPRNAIVDLAHDKGREFLIARTGYTGQDGVEVFFPAEDAADGVE